MDHQRRGGPLLQSYCWDVLDAADKEWRNQEEVRVRIDRNTLSDSIGLGQLRGAIRKVEHRIATRQRVASSRRGTLHHPVKMDVATADEVHEYKRDMVDDAVSLTNDGQFKQARRKLLEVCQMAEESEATLDAYRHLLELRELDKPSIAFVKIRFAREGARLAQRYDRENVLDEFREHYETAWDHIEETFVGARYTDPSGRPIRVLHVKRMQLLEGRGAETTAVVQHGLDLSDLQAAPLAESDEFDRIDSGMATDPDEQVCAEREHEFDKDVLRDAPTAAICETCGYSGEVLRQWFSQDVPTVCDECDTVVYEDPMEMEVPKPGGRVLCTDCRD